MSENLTPTPKIKDVIYLEDVTVQFGNFKALDNVIFLMRPGELRFLIGPNGAGKTTLLDVICHKVLPTSGRLFFEEKSYRNLSVHEVARMGISRKFQAPSVFASLTVRENMELAYPKARGLWEALWHRFSKEENDDIQTVLETVGLSNRENWKAAALSHGQKQWLEIALTLIQKPKLLLVDEPVAGMTREERTRTGHILEKIARTTSVLVVEHDMKFVEAFAQKVTVLHEGRILCEGPFAKVANDPRVLEVYLGRGTKE